MDEKAKKAQLKELKKMKPEQILSLKENISKKNDELKNMQSEIENNRNIAQNLGTQLLATKQTNDSLLVVVYSLQNEVEVASKAAAQYAVMANSNNGKLTDAMKKGAYFRIQLGAYKTGALNKSMDLAGVESEKGDGLNKYLFGFFKSLPEAEKVRNDFTKLGIADSWVVGYNNGTRILKEEAAEILKKKK